jgi:hypothetical protein
LNAFRINRAIALYLSIPFILGAVANKTLVIEVSGELCERYPTLTLQFVRLTYCEPTWEEIPLSKSDRILKGVRFRAAEERDELRGFLKEKARVCRQMLTHLQRHPSIEVIDSIRRGQLWLDYRYGACPCGSPVKIPGNDNFLCELCGYMPIKKMIRPVPLKRDSKRRKTVEKGEDLLCNPLSADSAQKIGRSQP